MKKCEEDYKNLLQQFLDADKIGSEKIAKIEAAAQKTATENNTKIEQIQALSLSTIEKNKAEFIESVNSKLDKMSGEISKIKEDTVNLTHFQAESPGKTSTPLRKDNQTTQKLSG